jgi:hypothetical protein
MRSAWIQHVMKHKTKKMSLGEAMKAAGPSWEEMKKMGGNLGGTVAGGRRSRRKTKKGGQLYTFAGGPYTGSPLADGAARLPAYPAMQWEGANPAAMTAGRRRRTRRIRR